MIGSNHHRSIRKITVRNFVVMLAILSFRQTADFRTLQRIDECGKARHEVCAFVAEEEMRHVPALKFQVH